MYNGRVKAYGSTDEMFEAVKDVAVSFTKKQEPDRQRNEQAVPAACIARPGSYAARAARS